MKRMITMLGAALLMATAAQAEVDSHERAAADRERAGTAQERIEPRNYATFSDGIAYTGQPKFETVFSSRDRQPPADGYTADKGR